MGQFSVEILPLPGSVLSGNQQFVAWPGYEVGYGKPPEATRFRKGQSGNPKGRPKGSKNKVPGLKDERMKALILEEAYRTIQVRDGTRNVTVPIAQAILRALAVNAVKGQHRSQRLFAELLSAVETSNKALHDEWLNAAMEYKIEWERELARRERLGITGLPEPLPHPDHVIIDIREGTARIAGPATKEEREQWDEWIARRADLEEELAETEALLATRLSPEMRAFWEDDAAQTRKILAILDRMNVPSSKGKSDRGG